MTSPATTRSGPIRGLSRDDSAEKGADTEGAQGEAIRGVWVTTRESDRKSRPVKKRSHKTHSSPSPEGKALRAPGGAYGAMWAGGQLSAMWHWSGAPQWTPEATSAQSPSGPVCAAPCPVSSWRALSIDGPGRPWVTQGWAHCRLLLVQLSGIGVSWAQRGGGHRAGLDCPGGGAQAAWLWQDPFEKAEQELQETLGPRVPALDLSCESAGRHAVPMQGTRMCGYA